MKYLDVSDRQNYLSAESKRRQEKQNVIDAVYLLICLQVTQELCWSSDAFIIEYKFFTCQTYDDHHLRMI